VSAGGVQVDAGGVVVNAGGIRVHSGGVSVESGGLFVRDGGAVYQSTAGFALEVVGKSAVRTTAENAPALAVSAASLHFEDTLLDLTTDTRVSVRLPEACASHDFDCEARVCQSNCICPASNR
jgi:hypothetical protein